MFSSATDEATLRKSLGSFWVNQLSENGRKISTALLSLVASPAAVGNINQTLKNVSGIVDQKLYDLPILFDPTAVINVNRIGYDGLAAEFVRNNNGRLYVTRATSKMFQSNVRKYDSVLLVENNVNNITSPPLFRDPLGFYVLSPKPTNAPGVSIRMDLNHTRPTWLVPVPSTLKIRKIKTLNDELILGIHFTQHPGYIMVHRNPKELFPSNTITVVHASAESTNVLYKVFDTQPIKGPTKYVADAFRGKTSNTKLAASIASVGGVAILEKDSKLLSYIENNVGATYMFDTGRIKVGYPHTLLTVGNVYKAGYQIGEMVKVYTAKELMANNLYTFPNGLSLDSFCPIKGVSLKSKKVKILPHSIITKSEPLKVKVRAELFATSKNVEDRFWNYMDSVQVNGDKYLSEFVWDATDDIKQIRVIKSSVLTPGYPLIPTDPTKDQVGTDGAGVSIEFANEDAVLVYEGSNEDEEFEYYLVYPEKKINLIELYLEDIFKENIVVIDIKSTINNEAIEHMKTFIQDHVSTSVTPIVNIK